MTHVHIRLVERSKTAKEFGGPAKIRELPLMERLQACAQITKEIGREKLCEKFATLAVKEAIIRHDYNTAEKIALEYNLKGYIQFFDALQKIV